MQNLKYHATQENSKELNALLSAAMDIAIANDSRVVADHHFLLALIENEAGRDEIQLMNGSVEVMSNVLNEKTERYCNINNTVGCPEINDAVLKIVEACSSDVENMGTARSLLVVLTSKDAVDNYLSELAIEALSASGLIEPQSKNTRTGDSEKHWDYIDEEAIERLRNLPDEEEGQNELAVQKKKM